MEALRALSTRARITATSLTNHYEWGDFKGNPKSLVERWFDLHLYLANWGTRRLMMRLPKRLVDGSRLDRFLMGSDLAEVIDAGEYLILDMYDNGEEADYDGRDDGSGWLGALAPLRADMLSGDWRLPYLLWLQALDSGSLRVDGLEPLPGIGPLTGALEAFAEFFRIDPYLVQAAAEAPAGGGHADLPPEAVHAAVASIPEAKKTEFLRRLVESDPYVAAEVRGRVRETATAPQASDGTRTNYRTVSQLQMRAAAIREEREAAEAARREAERLRQEREAEAARRARLEALRRRGDGVWREIESEVGQRNSKGYERATALLFDLRSLAEENEEMARFADRLNALCQRHERKKQFIERLTGLYPPRGT